jgi:hypothetical protein
MLALLGQVLTKANMRLEALRSGEDALNAFSKL